MLLFRHFDRSYERVLSYYETVSLQDVLTNWEYAACHIEDPHWQSCCFELDSNLEPDKGISWKKLNVRWAGLTFGYSVIEEFTNQGLSLFLLAQNSKPPYGLLIVVVCSMKSSGTLLDIVLQEDWRDISTPNLEGLTSNYITRPLWPLERSETGPAREKAFRINDKELVLTLSIEDTFDYPSPIPSRRVWTLWLSFRPLVNRSISDAVLKAISHQNSGIFVD